MAKRPADHDGATAELRATVAQLESGLESRVAIERAVGMLAERFDVSVSAAFAVLRRAARDDRRALHAMATEVVDGRPRTPAAVTAAREKLAS